MQSRGFRAASPSPQSAAGTCSTASQTTSCAAPQGGSRWGLFCGIAAYTAWGFIPLYFHILSDVPPLVILCHRIFWSVLFLVVVVSLRREWRSLALILRSPRNLLLLACGAVLIALNWLLFIYAVTTGQTLQASLGYFINPLLSVALGLVFLRERLRGWQWLAVGIATVAVALLALRGAGFPWLALGLAATFGFYGLVRKTVDIDSLHGLLVETAILFPLAVVMLALPEARHASEPKLGLLACAGVVTAVPLLFFGVALRTLKLSTVGFLQYIGPTGQFLVALLVFGETLDRAKLGTFALCWLALAICAADSVLSRQPQSVADEPE